MSNKRTSTLKRITKACEYCDKVFITRNPQRRFCSHNCRNRAWDAVHPEKARESWRRWAVRHPEEHRQRSRQYRETHLEKERERQRRYYQKHRAERREYDKNHRSERNAIHATYRALKKNTPMGDLDKIKELYRCAKEASKIRCYLCGKLIPKEHRHVDHIVPLSKRGLHIASNLAVACNKCNESKGAKMPDAIGLLI